MSDDDEQQQRDNAEEKLRKEMEGMDDDERLTYINQLSSTVYDEIIEKKHGEPSKWQSYWEKDEDDIEQWTEEEIRQDPIKGLLTAVEQGNLSLVQKYVEQDSSLLNARDSDGYTALHRSASGNHLKICEYLLESGADINALTNDKWTALHCSAFWNNYHIGTLLLQNGIDINAQTNGGQTPLHLAASQSNNREMIQLLLMHPFINVNIMNKLNESPMVIAKRSSSVHCLFDLYTDALTKLK
jgi:ankyrin repeat protein